MPVLSPAADMKRHVLTGVEIEEIRFLYEDRGWNPEHLGRKFEVAPSTIFRLAQREHFVRNVPKRRVPPSEVIGQYKKREHLYPEYVRQAKAQKPECTHRLWAARCAHCSDIIASDVLFVMIPRNEIEKNPKYRELLEKYGKR